MENDTMSPVRKEPNDSRYSGRVAKRIRELRDRKKLTVEDVVERMKQHGFSIAQPTFSQWETGRTKPSLDAFPALAKALGVPIRDLLPES